MKVTSESLTKTLARFDLTAEIISQTIEDVLAEVGETVVEGIRNGELSSWINQTGNLRSSIGYAVIKRGNVVRTSDFGVILGGAEGASKGRTAITEVASQYAQYDYVLAIVAGEEYSVYVEAIEGKVVLAEGCIHIERNLPKQLKERVQAALAKL
ncbi:MAG: hypothetical protein IJ640_09270 [Prevotella sp.]|nr:hypothetical protein [Prevotella sp.]